METMVKSKEEVIRAVYGALHSEKLFLEATVTRTLVALGSQIFHPILPQGPNFAIGASEETLAEIREATEAINRLTQIVDTGVQVKLNHGIQNPFESVFSSAESIYESLHSDSYRSATAGIWSQLKVLCNPENPAFRTCVFAGAIILSLYMRKHIYGDMMRRGMFLTAFVGILAGHLTYEVSSQIVNWVCDYLEVDDEIVPQSGCDTVVSIIATFIYGQCGYRSLEKRCISDFIKTIAYVPKQIDGIKYLVDFILKTIQSAANYFMEKLGKDPVILQKSMVPELDEIHVRIQRVINELRAGADYSYDMAQVIFQIERDLNTCVVNIPRTRDYEPYRQQARELEIRIGGLVTKMARNNIVGNGPRREPLAIMFGGPTGVGKSTSLVPLILAIMAKALPEELLDKFRKNHNDCIWNYIPENPFHDAYHGQFVTISDEVGALRDGVGSPDPGTLGLMRMINTASYPLHMAHLEDKGNCNFKSEIVIATTNRTRFDNCSMWFPEAFSRRFTESYLVVPRAEFCKEGTVTENLWERRLDLRKIPATDSGFYEDLNEFYPYDFCHKTHGVIGPPKSFVELIESLVQEYISKRDKGDRMIAHHTTVKERYLADRAKPQGGAMSIPETYADHHGGIIRDDDSDDDADDFADCVGEFPDGGTRVFFDDVAWPKSVFARVAPKLSADATPREIRKALNANILEELDAVSKGMEALTKPIKFHPVLAAIALAVPAMIVAWKFLYPCIFPQSGEVRQTKGSGRRKQRHSKPLSVYSVRDGGAPRPQANINQNSYDIANKIARKNMYTVFWHGKKFGYFTFLRGRVGVMPYHFVDAILDSFETDGFKETDSIDFRRIGAPESGFSARFCDIETIHDDTLCDDTVYVRFKSECHLHSNIASYVPREEEPLFNGRFDCALLRPSQHGYSLVTADAWSKGSTVYSDYAFDNGYEYNIPTETGDCGAVMFALSHTGRPYVSGIHVSGNGKVGFSTRLNKRTMDRVLAIWSDVVVDDFSEDPSPDAQIGDGFLVTEAVPKLRSPNKSKVVPSVLHSKWAPAKCSVGRLKPFRKNGVEIDPMALARSKYNKPRPAFNLDLLDACASSVVQDMVYGSDRDRPWPARVLFYHEAIVGVDGVDFVDSIKRGTSPGYPYVNMVAASGKTHWFGTDADFALDSVAAKRLQSEVENQIQDLKRGRRLGYVFGDFLKDQRLPSEKVDAGKARLVSCGPIDYLIICRMYFGDLVRWVMSNRIRNGSAIGVNAYSFEWQRIVMHLQSVGTDRMVFGDYSSYDGSLSPALMYTFQLLWEAFYAGCDPIDNVVRASLFESLVNSKHVYSNDPHHESIVYEWFGGNPSGNFLTSILNTFCNLVLIRYSLVSCRLTSSGRDHLMPYDVEMEDFVVFVQKHSRCIAFGDDNGISLSRDLAEHVTPTTLTDAMSAVGFRYTSESKDGANVFYRTIDACSFLKRGFRWLPGQDRYIANLDLDVILEMPMWTRADVQTDDLIATVDRAVMELSAHGEEIFGTWAPRIAKASTVHLRHTPRTSYVSNRAKFDGQSTMYT